MYVYNIFITGVQSDWQQKLAEFERQQKYQTILLEAILKKMELTKIDMNELDEQIELPVKTLDELTGLNKLLDNMDKKNRIVKQLSYLGGNSSRILTIRIINNIMTTELLKGISWKGTKEKLSIYKDLKNIFDVILYVVKKRYPLVADIATTVETILKNKFRNAANKNQQKKITKKKERLTTARCNAYKTFSTTSAGLSGGAARWEDGFYKVAAGASSQVSA